MGGFSLHCFSHPVVDQDGKWKRQESRKQYWMSWVHSAHGKHWLQPTLPKCFAGGYSITVAHYVRDIKMLTVLMHLCTRWNSIMNSFYNTALGILQSDWSEDQFTITAAPQALVSCDSKHRFVLMHLFHYVIAAAFTQHRVWWLF